MHSKDIEKFILGRSSGNFKIVLVDGHSVTAKEIEGLEWNAGNLFNMWVIRDEGGSGILIDGQQIHSITDI